MDDLFAVYVFKGVAYFTDYFLAELAVDVAGPDQVFQGVAVDPFHDDTIADHRVLDLGEVLTHAAVAERKSYVEILAE